MVVDDQSESKVAGKLRGRESFRDRARIVFPHWAKYLPSITRRAKIRMAGLRIQSFMPIHSFRARNTDNRGRSGRSA